MAVQALLDPNPLRLIANLAPAPHDIVWQNTYISRTERIVRMWTITVLIAVLTVFWLAPVGTLAGLLNIKSIKRVWPWLAEALASNQLVSSLVQNTLPTVVLTLLNVAVPYIYDCKCFSLHVFGNDADVCRALKHARNDIPGGRRTFCHQQKLLFYFLQPLFCLHCLVSSHRHILVRQPLTLTSGTVTDMYEVLKDSFKDSTTIAYRLAGSLGSFAPFYTNLIILQGVGMFPFRLLEFGTVALYPISLMGSKTPRDYAELVAPPVFQYGFYLPQPILILILCLVYSLLRAGSVMLGFGLIYFSIGYFTYKYQLLYGKPHILNFITCAS